MLLLRHTADEPTAEQLTRLAARNICVVDGVVASVQVADDRLVGVRLASGTDIAVDAVVVMPTFTARTDALDELGLRPVAWPAEGSTGMAVKAGPGGVTDVPGVWAAGNATDLYAGVLQSAAAGVTAGAAINADLVAEDTDRAVAAHLATGAPPQPTDAEHFWDRNYQRPADRAVSMRMNPAVAGVVSGLVPGRVLDLGCGEGGDALALAGLGWQVTAVDVSHTVLQRLRDRAHAAGLSDRIIIEQHDLSVSTPQGTFDLVNAAYLQSPVDLDRDRVLRAAAYRLAPGGLLLIVDHGSTAPWSWDQDPARRFDTPAELFAGLGLPAHEWRAEQLDAVDRTATGPSGEAATVTDTVVAVRRLPPRERASR